MVTFPAPICYYCKHFDQSPSVIRCEAYPYKIPDEIWLSVKFHTEPYPGDRGIRFEPIPGKEQEAKEYLESLRSG